MDEIRYKICSSAVSLTRSHCPATLDDLTHLKTMLRETDKKLVALKESFKGCQQLHDVYADIAKTYYEISSGDYISRLVEEERKRQDGEKQKKTKSDFHPVGLYTYR